MGTSMRTHKYIHFQKTHMNEHINTKTPGEQSSGVCKLVNSAASKIQGPSSFFETGEVPGKWSTTHTGPVYFSLETWTSNHGPPQFMCEGTLGPLLIKCMHYN